MCQNPASVPHVLGGGGGGGQAFHFGKNDFELGVGGDGQDTFRHFEGSFRSIRAILPIRGLGPKTGAKTRIELKVIQLSYCHHSIYL